MNDVQFAKAPRFLQWTIVVLNWISWYRPVIMPAGRRAELLDVEEMVRHLHERQVEEFSRDPRLVVTEIHEDEDGRKTFRKVDYGPLSAD